MLCSADVFNQGTGFVCRAVVVTFNMGGVSLSRYFIEILHLGGRMKLVFLGGNYSSDCHPVST